MDWNGQVAVVTGGSRGIGTAICRRLAGRGAAVGINYVARSTEAEALRAEIVAAGGRAALLQAVVAYSAAVAAMFAEAKEKLGTLSILVNNAGVSTPATLETYDASQLERMRAVNVNGVIHTVRAVMTGMKARNYGRIVNIASNAAIGTALPGTTFYAATKSEVLILTRRFAMELGTGPGSRVNAGLSWLDRHRCGSTRCKRGGVRATRGLNARAHHGRSGWRAGGHCRRRGFPGRAGCRLRHGPGADGRWRAHGLHSPWVTARSAPVPAGK